MKLPPSPADGFSHAYHLFPIRVAERDRMYDSLQGAGIGVQIHYVPIYRHALYGDLGLRRGDFAQTESAYEELLSLPLFPDLTHEEQDKVVEAIATAIE